MSTKKVIKKSRKLSFELRYSRVCTNLGFYLGTERISHDQYDRFLWKLLMIINNHKKTL